MAWSIRPDGSVDFVNQRWMDYTGLSLAEESEEAARPIHPEDVPRVIERWQVEKAAGEPYEDEMRLRRADGVYRWFLVRTAPLRDEQGNLVKWYGVSIDIEDRKQAEERLKASTEQLRALSARLQSAREEEATRISREIHDELGSSLTRLKWDLQLIVKEKLGTQDQAELGKLGQRIEQMIQLIDTIIDTVRRVSAELRPSLLDDLGLIPALRWETDRFGERTDIETNFHSSLEGIDLTPQHSTAVFRIFEEALTNVMRHAQATRVEVKLEQTNDELVLTIRDNGRGITAVEKTNRLSLGLLSMRERANIVGGQTDITGNKDGTTIIVHLPISGKQ
jgi:PAS domain S-box-containing protein